MQNIGPRDPFHERTLRNESPVRPLILSRIAKVMQHAGDNSKAADATLSKSPWRDEKYDGIAPESIIGRVVRSRRSKGLILPEEVDILAFNGLGKLLPPVATNYQDRDTERIGHIRFAKDGERSHFHGVIGVDALGVTAVVESYQSVEVASGKLYEAEDREISKFAATLGLAKVLRIRNEMFDPAEPARFEVGYPGAWILQLVRGVNGCVDNAQPPGDST
jgi:hypothetical protein